MPLHSPTPDLGNTDVTTWRTELLCDCSRTDPWSRAVDRSERPSAARDSTAPALSERKRWTQLDLTSTRMNYQQRDEQRYDYCRGHLVWGYYIHLGAGTHCVYNMRALLPLVVCKVTSATTSKCCSALSVNHCVVQSLPLCGYTTKQPWPPPTAPYYND